jgi:hypothetical protein
MTLVDIDEAKLQAYYAELDRRFREAWPNEDPPDFRPVRLDTGLYMAHANFGIHLKFAGLLRTISPFMDGLRSEIRWSGRDYSTDPINWDAYPSEYGVCDTPEQVLAHVPLLTTDPRRFIVFFTPPIRKHDQPAEGGWRWHKWGEYIGTQPQAECEYLYDEPHIDEVLVYHIVEVL